MKKKIIDLILENVKQRYTWNKDYLKSFGRIVLIGLGVIPNTKGFRS